MVQLQDSSDGKVGLYFRPHDVSLKPAQTSEMAAAVVGIRRSGATIRATLSVSLGNFEVELPHKAAHNIGDHVDVELNRYSIFSGNKLVAREG